jgi:hypothetical protein
MIERPGWIRMSVHPTMTNKEVVFVCDAIKEVAKNAEKWGEEYTYDASKNEYIHNSQPTIESTITKNWF